MRRHAGVYWSSVAAGVLALSFPAGELRAQSGGALLPTAAVFPRTYEGNCPAQVEFVGHVTVTVPGTSIEYQWERSNGTSGKVLHAQIGKPVAPGNPPDTGRKTNVTEAVTSDKWRLGLPGRGGRFWEVLHVLTPIDIRSTAATVEVACRA